MGDDPPPVFAIVMVFGELVEIEMPAPAAIVVVEFDRPLMAVMPLPPPEAEIVMTFGELVAMVMLVPATRDVVALLSPLMAVMPLPVLDALAGAQLVPLYVRTWFVVGAVEEIAIP